jgi:hypothetical protein
MLAPRPRSLVRAAAVVALTGALAGCGAGSGGGDLLAVDRAGDVPDARLRIVVEDPGLVHCNGSAGKRMPDQLLLDARELQRDLIEPAKAGLDLPAAPQSVLQYDIVTADGRVRFADNSRGPAVLDRAAYFTRQVSQQVCGLPR